MENCRNSDSVGAFLAASNSYLELLRNCNEEPAAGFQLKLRACLAMLYATALGLPEVEPTTSGLPGRDEIPKTNGIRQALGSVLGFQYYQVVSEQGNLLEPALTIGDVLDDLLDIYIDLSWIVSSVEGELQPSHDVIWQAGFEFKNHWGKHCVDALQVLHVSGG